MDIKGLVVVFVGSELWLRFVGQNSSPLSYALEQCSELVLSSRCGLQDVICRLRLGHFLAGKMFADLHVCLYIYFMELFNIAQY